MIQLQNVSFGYKKNKPLFTSLDLQVEEGNIYGLLGKNGAGKSTLLKMMAGLLFPKSGIIDVMGYEPRHRHPDFLADLYFIHEELYTPNLRVNRFEKIYAPFYPKFSHDQFQSYLEEFQLDATSSLQGLSYGQKKKVLLSFGLATNSRLLILDEPTNGLDIPSKSQFRKLLAKSISDDRTFIISTHQVRDMSNLIDPIIILENGEIIFQENLTDVSQKLSFHVQYSSTEPEDALHVERLPGAYRIVTPNLTGEETEVELEALFNTVIFNQKQIAELFQKEVNHEK